MLSLHMPKSASLQWPSLSRRTLSNFRSLNGKEKRDIYILPLLSCKFKWKTATGLKIINYILTVANIFLSYLTEADISAGTQTPRSTKDRQLSVVCWQTAFSLSLWPWNGSQEMSDMTSATAKGGSAVMKTSILFPFSKIVLTCGALYLAGIVIRS